MGVNLSLVIDSNLMYMSHFGNRKVIAIRFFPEDIWKLSGERLYCFQR